MRILIVDDEPAARHRLQLMLDELDVEVAGVACDGMEALARVRELRPDVLLLDIQMPDIDGIDVVRHLAEPRPLIIFQTAHAAYATDAFDQEAVDFVVKPVTLQRLQRAIERARKRLERAQQPVLSDAVLAQLNAQLTNTPTRARRLLVQDGTAHRLLSFREVLQFESADGIVRARTDSGSYIADYTLAELEARTAGRFVRASRSALVNIERIVRIESTPAGMLTLRLADQSVVRVSRRRTNEVRAALEA